MSISSNSVCWVNSQIAKPGAVLLEIWTYNLMWTHHTFGLRLSHRWRIPHNFVTDLNDNSRSSIGAYNAVTVRLKNLYSITHTAARAHTLSHPLMKFIILSVYSSPTERIDEKAWFIQVIKFLWPRKITGLLQTKTQEIYDTQTAGHVEPLRYSWCNLCTIKPFISWHGLIQHLAKDSRAV